MEASMKSLLLLPLVAGVGCVPNTTNLTIDRYVPALTDNACVVSPTQMDVAPTGILDVGLLGTSGRGYVAFPVVTNHLPASTTVQGGVEQHSIIFKGANVELVPDASLAGRIPEAQRKFFVGVPGSRIDPSGSVAQSIEVIPLAVAEALATGGITGLPTITANVSPVGDYSGDTVVGGVVPFPVQICAFCLSGPPTACPSGGFLAAEIKAGCIPSQDANVTCCVDNQNTLLCGSQVPMKTL
jgi:hypothetical protein